MIDSKLKSLIEGAYAQTPTLPGYWIKYDVFRDCFNELISKQTDEVIDIDYELFRLFPDTSVQDKYQIKGDEDIFRAIRITPQKLTVIKKFRRSIETTYKSSSKDSEGWTNFATFGLNGLKDICLEMGFDGLRQSVQCIFGKRFEFRQGDISKHEAPVLVRDLKEYGDGQNVDEQRNNDDNYKPGIVPKACVQAPRQGSFIGDAIDKWAYFPRPKDVNGYGWDYQINDLAANKALGERWYYYDKDQITKPILKRYISYTFERLRHEDEEECKKAQLEGRDPQKKIIENDRYAVWNTGLVNYLYEPIYAFFSRNDGRSPHIRQPWIFRAFDTPNSNQQSILAQFPNGQKPARAQYYTDLSELFYDLKGGAPTFNRDHIFFDNIDRLPMDFIKKDATSGFQFIESFDDLSYEEKQDYKAKLEKAIRQDIDWFDSLNSRFKQAIDRAFKRVEWNYKTAIPTYYIEEREISILLPLALGSKGKVNVALVCKHNYNPNEGINNYEGKTILTLEMAYSNARLITRPDSDWLLTDMNFVDNSKSV